MEERENQGTCTICGEELAHEETEHLLCGVCVETWEREVDCYW